MLARVQELRNQAKEAAAQGRWADLRATLDEVFRLQPAGSTASFVLSHAEALQHVMSFSRIRVAILRSFTVEPLITSLRASALLGGIAAEVKVGEFNAYTQEVLDSSSWLYKFDPGVVILAVQTRDLAPELWDAVPLGAEALDAIAGRVLETYESLVKALRDNSTASLVIHSLELPVLGAHGVLDDQSESGQSGAVRRINAGLRRIAAAHRGVYVLDYDSLVSRHGRLRWHDEQKWLTVRMPIAADFHREMVREWLRFLHPLTGRVAKVLVTDLDNTLWGGVVGEDGLAGIKLGIEYPGAGFRALQQAMFDCYSRGILLAVASKNNEKDALEAIDSHEQMILRRGHFAALRINWNDKAQSLREIAAELNVGIDALAFVDDNPAERARVRQELPEVTVIDLPENPLEYARALRSSPVFERLTVSAEDRERGRFYADQNRRADLERNVTSVEDFYRSLDQEVEVTQVAPDTLSRVAQLTQKTNQFNVTTRRYNEQQISEMTSAGAQVFAVRVKDRFGDNGIVGVVIGKPEGARYSIDSFLLSCRVIGRTVETAIMSCLAEEARSLGAGEMVGEFIPTRKNEPANRFFETHGFEPAGEKNGASVWRLDLRRATLACPEWIRLNYRKGVPSEYALT
jgi:FkbH-like protein